MKKVLLGFLLLWPLNLFAQHFVGLGDFRNSTGSALDTVYITGVVSDSLVLRGLKMDSIRYVRERGTTIVDTTKVAFGADSIATDPLGSYWRKGFFRRAFRASDGSGNVGQYTVHVKVYVGSQSSANYEENFVFNYTVVTDRQGDVDTSDYVADIGADVIGSSELATGAIGTAEWAAEADNNGINWADIDNPTSTQGLSGTQVHVYDTDSSGRVGLVGQLEAGAIGAGAISANAITASTIATDAIGALELGADAAVEVRDTAANLGWDTQDNLISNPSFERSEGGNLVGWRVITGNGGRAEVAAKSGKYGMVVRGDGVDFGIVESDSFALDTGDRIRLTGIAKDKPSAAAIVEVVNSANSQIALLNLSTPNLWHGLIGNGVITLSNKGTGYFRVRLENGSTAAADSLLTDNIAVKVNDLYASSVDASALGTDAAQEIASVVADTTAQLHNDPHNLIQNGDFEAFQNITLGSQPKNMGWSQATATARVLANAYVRQGRKVLRLNGASAKAVSDSVWLAIGNRVAFGGDMLCSKIGGSPGIILENAAGAAQVSLLQQTADIWEGQMGIFRASTAAYYRLAALNGSNASDTSRFDQIFMSPLVDTLPAGAASISAADMGAVADSVWKKKQNPYDGVTNTFGNFVDTTISSRATSGAGITSADWDTAGTMFGNASNLISNPSFENRRNITWNTPANTGIKTGVQPTGRYHYAISGATALTSGQSDTFKVSADQVIKYGGKIRNLNSDADAGSGNIPAIRLILLPSTVVDSIAIANTTGGTDWTARQKWVKIATGGNYIIQLTKNTTSTTADSVEFDDIFAEVLKQPMIADTTSAGVELFNGTAVTGGNFIDTLHAMHVETDALNGGTLLTTSDNIGVNWADVTNQGSTVGLTGTQVHVYDSDTSGQVAKLGTWAPLEDGNDSLIIDYSSLGGARIHTFVTDSLWGLGVIAGTSTPQLQAVSASGESRIASTESLAVITNPGTIADTLVGLALIHDNLVKNSGFEERTTLGVHWFQATATASITGGPNYPQATGRRVLKLIGVSAKAVSDSFTVPVGTRLFFGADVFSNAAGSGIGIENGVGGSQTSVNVTHVGKMERLVGYKYISAGGTFRMFLQNSTSATDSVIADNAFVIMTNDSGSPGGGSGGGSCTVTFSAGTGANTIVFTTKDSANSFNVVDGVVYEVRDSTSQNVQARYPSNQSGITVFSLNNGSYYVKRFKPTFRPIYGSNPSPQDSIYLVVSGNGSRTDTIVASTFTSPSPTGRTRVYGFIRDLTLDSLVRFSVKAKLATGTGQIIRCCTDSTSPVIQSPIEKEAIIGWPGYWYIDVVPSDKYYPDTQYEFTFSVEGMGVFTKKITIPDQSTFIFVFGP